MLSLEKIMKRHHLSSLSHTILGQVTTFYHLRPFSSSAPAIPKSNFTGEDYLITSCGFSPTKAAALSKRISLFKTPEQPDSVRHFLKHHIGFTEAHIRSVISNYPPILSADIDETLRPRLEDLQSMGFTHDQLQKVITDSPILLRNPAAVPRLAFWKTFLGGDLEKLILVLTRNRSLISLGIDNSFLPKLSLLKNYGLSENDIRKLLLKGSSLILRSTASIEELLKHSERLGFQRGSTMFVHGFWVLHIVGYDQLMSKMELFKSFGWSDEEFLAALRKFPYFAALSEDNIRRKMDFLVSKAGCTQSYIASHHIMLTYSLERRLIPRHAVMDFLETNGLMGKEWDISYVLKMTEDTFKKRIIEQYAYEAPTLLDIYVAACPMNTVTVGNDGH